MGKRGMTMPCPTKDACQQHDQCLCDGRDTLDATEAAHLDEPITDSDFEWFMDAKEPDVPHRPRDKFLGLVLLLVSAVAFLNQTQKCSRFCSKRAG